MRHTKLFEEFINEASLFGKKEIIERAQEILAMAKDSRDLGFIEKIVKSGRLPDYKQHVNVNIGEKPDQYKILQGSNALLLAKEIAKVVKKYKKYEVVEEKMRGRLVSRDGKVLKEFHPDGKIAAVANRHVNNAPGFEPGTASHIIAVTCGGKIKTNIKEKLFNEIYELLFVFNESNDIDGGVNIDFTFEESKFGDNFNIIGLSVTNENNLLGGSSAMTANMIMK